MPQEAPKLVCEVSDEGTLIHKGASKFLLSASGGFPKEKRSRVL